MPARASVVANGCISCWEPANPCAMTTTGARPADGGENIVTGVVPTRALTMLSPARLPDNIQTATTAATAATASVRLRARAVRPMFFMLSDKAT